MRSDIVPSWKFEEALASRDDETVIAPLEPAQRVDNKMVEKWDPRATGRPLDARFASARVDVDGVLRVLAKPLLI